MASWGAPREKAPPLKAQLPAVAQPSSLPARPQVCADKKVCKARLLPHPVVKAPSPRPRVACKSTEYVASITPHKERSRRCAVSSARTAGSVERHCSSAHSSDRRAIQSACIRIALPAAHARQCRSLHLHRGRGRAPEPQGSAPVCIQTDLKERQARHEVRCSLCRSVVAGPRPLRGTGRPPRSRLKLGARQQEVAPSSALQPMREQEALLDEVD